MNYGSLTLMLLVANFVKLKLCEKIILKPCLIGIHLIALRKSFQMNTDMTQFT